MPTNALIDPLGIEQSDPLQIESGQGYKFPTPQNIPPNILPPSFDVPVSGGARNIVPAATEPDATQYPKLFIPPPTTAEIATAGSKLNAGAPETITPAEALREYRADATPDEGPMIPMPKLLRLKNSSGENMRKQALTELGQSYLKLADAAQTFGGGFDKVWGGEGGRLKALPFIGALASVPQQKLRNDLLNKVKAGSPLDDTEKATVDALLLAQRRIYQPEKFWEKVGELTGGSAPYALEFALSAGTYSWAKTAAGRWLLSVPGDALTAGLARGAGVAAQTAVGSIPRVASEYLDRMAPKWNANPKDFKSIVFDEEADKNWLEQLTKSFGSQYIENLSERLSGPIGRGGDIVLDKLGAKRLFARSVRLGAIQDALNKGAAKNFMDAANKMKSAAGFTGGVTGEVLEEYAGNGLKSLSGVDTQNSVPQELWKGDFVGAARAFLNSLPVKDTPAMVVSFGIIPAGQHAIGLGLAGAGKAAEKLDERRQEKAFDLLSADVANRNALEATMPAPANGQPGQRPFSDAEQLPVGAVIPEDATQFPTRVATGLQASPIGETQNLTLDDPRRLVVLPKRKALRRANSRRISLSGESVSGLASAPEAGDIDRVAQWLSQQDPQAAVPPERMIAEISKQYRYTTEAAQLVYDGALARLGIGGQNAGNQPSTAQVGVLGQGGAMGAQASLRQPGQAPEAGAQAQAPGQPQVSRDWLINITPPTTLKGKQLPGEAISNIRPEIQANIARGRSRRARLISLQEERKSPERKQAFQNAELSRRIIESGEGGNTKILPSDVDRVESFLRSPEAQSAKPEQIVSEISRQYGYSPTAARQIFDAANTRVQGGQNASSQPSTAEVGVLGQGGKVGPQAPLRQPGQAAETGAQAQAPGQPQVSRDWLINITPPTTLKGKQLPGEEAYKAYQEKLPEIAKARAEAARNHVNNSVADRTEVPGVEVRLAGARDRMADFGYIFDEAADVYRPARITQGGQNAGNQPSTAQVGVLGQGGKVGAQAPLRQPGQASQAVPQAETPGQPQVSRDWLINITPPETLRGKQLPGAVQIDMMEGGQNRGSTNPQELSAKGYSLPASADFFKLPKGRYTLGQALDLLAQQANQAQKGVTPNGQEEKGRQALLTKLSPDAFLHPSGAPNGARAKVRWAVVSAANAGEMVNRTVNEFQPSQRQGDVEAKELRFKIAATPDTSILFEAAAADRGAPTIDAQAMRAVAGNTRLWGLIDGYQSKTKGIRRYREEVLKKAAQISPELQKQAESIEDPILVLMADGYEGGTRSQFVVEANQTALQREDSVTQSMQDARALGDLTRYSFTAQGLLTSQSAQVAAAKLQSSQRQKDIRTRSGAIDMKKLSARVQRAAMASMAQSAGLDVADLIYLFENEHGQRVVSEVVRAAPLLSKLEGDLNLGADLILALRELQIGLEAVRDSSVASLDEWFQNRSNELAGVRNQLSQQSELLIGQMVLAQKKPKLLREVLEGYAAAADTEQRRRRESQGADLTGETRNPVSGGQILGDVIKAKGDSTIAAKSGSKPTPIAAAKVSPVAPAGSMAEELDRILRLREKLGRGTKEIEREGKRFLEWLSANRPDIKSFDDIQNADLMEYATSGVEAGRQIDANSRNKYLRFVAQVLEWLSPDHPRLLQLSKSMAFEPAKSPPRVEGSRGGFFKPEATAKLVSPETSSDPYRIRDKAFFALMRYTGFRVEDVARLRLDQIDLERGIIRNALISKTNLILPMRAIPELAIYNIRRYLESGARDMLGDKANPHLFQGTGKKGFITVGNMLLRIQKMAAEDGVTLANEAEAQTKAFRSTFAQDLVVGARLDKTTVNELSGRVGDDVTESNYLSRHSDENWIENVNRPAVSALPENVAFTESAIGRGEQTLPKADAAMLQWRQRKASGRNLSVGLSGKRLARYNYLSDKESLTPTEQRELEELSNVDQAPLFGADVESQVQASATQKAADLRKQADENERLGNLRLEAWALGEKKARGEADAYFNEAVQLRKLAREFEARFQKQTRAETPDLFDRNLSPGSSGEQRQRIGFNTSDNGFTITYSKNPFGGTVREIRADNLNDLAFLVGHPSLQMDETLRSAFKGIIASGVLDRLPMLRVAITDFVEGSIPGSQMYRGEYIQSQQLARLWNLANSVDAAHEVLHHIHRFLSSADRDWIRVMRMRAIGDELSKSRNYAELGQLEKLMNEEYSSDGFEEAGFDSKLYHLANEYEFFAWMMQERAAKDFTRMADVRFIDRVRAILRDLYYSLRRFLNLTSKDEELWQKIISGTYEYDLESAKRWAADTERNLSIPAEETAYVMAGDRLDPETAWAQIESASRLAIPAVVQSKLDDYNAAIGALEEREYDTQRYREAKDYCRRLADEVAVRAEQSTDAFWQIQDNWPSFSSENLQNALDYFRIDYNAQALLEAQTELRFERRARSLANWRRQLEGVNQTIATFQSLGWNPEDYQEFTQTAERLTKSISRFEFNPDRENAQRMTVNERAREIEAARVAEPEQKAKRDSLAIPMVNQIFVAPTEAGYVPSSRLTRTLQGFESAMNGGVSPHYQDAIAKQTWDNIVEFETARDLFEQWSGLEKQRVSRQLRAAQNKLADSKIDFGLAVILADESVRVGQGERGLTGSLSSREAVNFLNDSFGTLMAFARSLRAAYPTGGAEPVLMRVLAGLASASPETFTADNSYFGTISKIEAELSRGNNPELDQLRRNAGVADYALARILYALARSDKLENAVAALLRYGERQMSDIPANQLDRIAALLDSGDDVSIIEAQDRLRLLADEARRQQGILSREIKSIEREISDAEVALMAIDRGRELFDAVEANPQFHQIRKRVVEHLNLRQEMIADTGGSSGDQRGVSLIFKKFSLDAAGVKINRDEDLVINAADEVYDKRSDFLRIQDWYNDAKRYVIAFREADTRNRLDPENNRTPEALGFDRTIYNGLEDALKREGRFQDTGILFLEGSLQHNVFQQWLTGMSFFRQFLMGLKMANGQAAKSALSAAIHYGNTLNTAKTIYQRHKFKVQKARLMALKSHKEFNNDLELYREQVFNEMAAEGRQFGDSLRPGMTLPVTGQVVTSEDIDYLRAVQEMSNDYMRNVSERFAGGILEERGHEKSGTRRVFRRRAASVGEYGLPMQLKESAKEWMRKLIEAYAKKDERPTAATDLTGESRNKAVIFWNRNAKYLTRHILDSGRQFRTIEQEPEIMRAEQRAAAELRELNNPKAIQSVDDAVALIAKYLPRDSGRDVREWAASGLLAELEQYFPRAESALPKAAEVEKSQGIGGVTARSEFSTAAAQFNFPSNLYEYGAVTNRDMLMQSSRVMHEPIMELNRSMERVQAALSSEIDAMQESASLATNYSNVKEALRVRKIIQGLIGDLAKSWNFKDSDVARHGLEMPPDIIKSALLAGLTVNIRNIITGGLLQFNNIAMLDRHSRMFGLLKALRNVSAISARVPLELMFGQDWPVGRYGKKWIIEPMRKLGHPLTQMLLDRVIESELPSFIKQGAMTASRLTPWAIVDAHNDYVAKVQQLGFSLRDPQWEALKRMVGDTNVHQTTLGGQLDSGKMSTVRRAAGNVSGAGSLFFRGIGAEYFDKIINAQSLAGAAAMERLLCELSEVYGESRKGFGEYNPADARWRIAPEDYSKRLSKWGQQQNLAAFLDFMAGADLQVESLLWNYYTQMQAFRDGKRTEPSMLSDDQFDALRAAFIRAMNAGDALNRPASLRNSRLWRVLATFQGYVSNYLLSLIGLGNGVRNSSAWSKYVLGTQMAVAYAFSSTAIILISNAATDWWKRHMQGAAQRQVTILTREFWTDANKSLDASTDAAIASVPFVGDLALFIRGSIVNNRGYEPTGRVLAFSLLNDAFATTRGVFNLVRNDPENALNPIRDMILKYVGLGKEVAYATSPHYQAVKDFNAGQGVLRYQNEQAGFLQDKEAGNVKSGQYYSATSGIREDLKADMVAHDPEKLARDYKKLVDYYTNKGLKNAQSVAVNDVRQMHPAVQAMGGKKPTQEQFDTVYKGLSAAQRASVDKSISAWNWGADTLGINYSPFASAGLGAAPSVGSARIPAGRRISLGATPKFAALKSAGRRVSARLRLPRRTRSQGSRRRISLGGKFAFRRPSFRLPRISLA